MKHLFTLSLLLVLFLPAVGFAQLFPDAFDDEDLPPGIELLAPRKAERDIDKRMVARDDALNFLKLRGNFVKANELGLESGAKVDFAREFGLDAIVGNRFERALTDLDDKNRSDVEALAEYLLLAECKWFPESKLLQPKMSVVKKDPDYAKAVVLAKKLKALYLADTLKDK